MEEQQRIVAICQYGGEFVNNSDGSMTYSGGEAHALEVAHGMSFDAFKFELTSVFNVDVNNMSIKYFLPGNTKTLITVSNNKDLARMIDFTSNVLTAEVYIINKVENRMIVADSGTSNIGTAANAQDGKRKRITKTYVNVFQPGDPNVIPSASGNIGNNLQKQLIENDDHRANADDGFLIPFVTPTASLDDSRQRIMNIDMVDESVISRATGNILVDPSTPLFTSLVTTEDVRPINSSSHWDTIISGVGQEFDNAKDFRSQLCNYAIGKGFAYKFVKNESSRVTVRCAEDTCPWRIHASETSNKLKFVIKKMTNVHTCNGGNGQRKATRQWLTKIIKEKLHCSPQCKPKDLVREIYEDFGVNLTYSQVWRGREVAQKELFDSMKETYNQLPWFAEKILETNPNSVALLSASLDTKFRHFFVSFHASLHGFEHGCRPLLFLDRIPLKATNQHKLLVAATVDGNDAVFPVAFAVVEDENYDSWFWFLFQLKCAVTTSRTITFVSNRQKGLDGAILRVFEDNSHHCYCLHHLLEEFKNELRKGPWSSQVKDAMIGDFTRAAQACSIEDFNASIESIRNFSAEAAEWILATKPENWSDAIFKGFRYDHLSSNIVDSFMNWIPAKRESSVVHMFDAIISKLGEVIEERRAACNTWAGPLTPTMEQKLQKEMLKARKLNVLCSSDTVFEVRGNAIFVVNIGSWECTCKRWQISGLPCLHAVAAFIRVEKDVYDYCSRYFRIDCYQLTYSESVRAVPNIESIDFFSGTSSFPPTRRPPGRPRRKRFNPNKINTAIRLCSRCKIAGHNKATCEAFL
ncbi:uncharacterized protein LOC122047481 isoform X1 [Zingiber officinale]|uniref:uncharacterized protein LOC122047481 isoform X1 n=1 Tax=Zingiber officinale TaxID=94328 RepID=UPI001C4D8B5C|nr:uncharacterized protein LOC122047481 isoform X1 [Zingiber officinale]XP_042464749.1 uncharacterized protein LOC122047481 isoform X1 [Zingiber officinale]XP_042464750.1 uncharacterized protein LOC122047481 isoform X1 [Zingiber officinale]